VDNSQAKTFGDELSAVFEIYGKDRPSKNIKTIWWRSLEIYSLEAVVDSLRLHVSRSPFFPKPSDVTAILLKMDGRPEGEEAWALALKCSDESDTIIWTQEMAECWAIAQPIVEAGDMVGARMAFKQHYERVLQNARESGATVNWTLSLGHDPERRNDIIKEAVKRNVITQDRAKTLLISNMTAEGQEIVALIGHDGVADESKGKAFISAHREHINEMRKSLADGTALTDARKQQAKIDEVEKLEARRELLIKQSEKGIMNIQTPAAKNTDPITSHMAVDEVNGSGKRITNQQIVLDALRLMNGSTGAEIAKESGLEVHEVRRRLNDLAGLFASQGSHRKCKVANRVVQTWWLV